MKLDRLTSSMTIIAFLVVCVLPPTAHARATKLIEPAPVTTNCVLTLEDMKKAITAGGAVRGWTVVDQTPGNIELKYVKGAYKHVLSVNVQYTKNTYSVTYKDSTNLNYKVKRNGVREIHPRPIGWMKNLSIDIQTKTDVVCNK